MPAVDTRIAGGASWSNALGLMADRGNIGISGFAREFDPSNMFTPTTPGWVYDLSDFSTLFQDQTASTPVTAVEQPVGLVKDLSPQGNHASQPTATKRPVLSSRVNLLTYSEDFTNAAWSVSNVTIQPNSALAPDGTMTACVITATAAFGHMLQQAFGVVGTTYKQTFYIRRKTGTGAINTWDSAGVQDDIRSQISSTWAAIDIPAAAATSTSVPLFVQIATSGDAVEIWHPQIECGQAFTKYQRITTATNYDTAGFPLYLKGDGVDDFMSTAAIDFTGTDTISYWGGVQKLSDTNAGVVFELGTNSATVNGTFGLLAPHTGASSTFAFNSRGTAYAQAVATGYASPYSGTISVANDISTPSLSIAVNTDAAVVNTNTQGAGNYSSNPVYFMSRAGTSTFSGAQVYSSIMLGRAATPAESINSKAWVDARRTVTV